MKIYTTDIIDRMKNITSITFRGIEGFRKPGLNFCHTYEELDEYARCKSDPIYFMEKYCQIMTHDGFKHLELRPYQKEIIKDHITNRFNITANSRQTGITTVISLLMLYDSIFNLNKTNVLIDNKLMNAVEKIQKIRDLYARLPYFLKPGVLECSQTNIHFENGSRIKVMSAYKGGVGFSIDSLFINDFAYITPTMAENIMKSVIPSVTSSKDSKIFISSSPNGYNHFAKMFMNAERKEGDPNKNMYNPHRVYWWEVPGRDEIWKNQMIANLGSFDEFDQSFDLMFFKRKDI